MKTMRQRIRERIESLREIAASYHAQAKAARAAGQERTANNYARRSSAVRWALDIVQSAKPELFGADEDDDPIMAGAAIEFR